MGLERINKKWKELSSNLNFEFEASIGETSWSYEAAYNGSIYTSQLNRQGLLRSNVDEYFLVSNLVQMRDGILFIHLI